MTPCLGEHHDRLGERNQKKWRVLNHRGIPLEETWALQLFSSHQKYIHPICMWINGKIKMYFIKLLNIRHGLKAD